MHPFYGDLKKARQTQGITLEQISLKTRIDMKFLTAIEEGNVSILPEAYIRAFLRAYAQAAGLDAESVLKGHDEATGKTVITHPPKPVSTFDDIAPAERSVGGSSEKRSLPMRPWTKLGFTAIILLGLLLSVWILIPRDEPQPVQETPFERVIQENEQRAVLSSPQRTDSPQPPALVADDSLTLNGATFDSVWLRVVIDNNAPQDHLLAAKASITWRARDRFTLTLGNAGGVRFTLGKKDLGFLGKAGTVVRDVQITRKGVTIDTTATR